MKTLFAIILTLEFVSCTPQRYMKAPVRCVNVYRSATETVHQFETLFEGRTIEYFGDSARCNEGDTLICVIRGRKIDFIKYVK